MALITPTFAPDYAPAYHPAPCNALVVYVRGSLRAGDELGAADFQLPDGRWPRTGDLVPACENCGESILAGIGPAGRE